MFLDLSLDNRVLLNDPLDCAIQELDMIFNTTNTELINRPEYGSDFEQFLWQMTPSPNELSKYIHELINDYTYYAATFNITVNVKTEMGELRDIYYVEIVFNDVNTDTEEQKKKSRRVYMLT